MSTGKTNHAVPIHQAVELRFDAERVVVVLKDGREISVPLHFYPTLQRASTRERAAWTLIGKGQGFHWAKLNLDLSTDGMIQGLREIIPEPPRRGDATARGSHKAISRRRAAMV
jgi:hypothetical protein